LLASNVKATFFPVASNVNLFKNQLLAVLSAGHIIGLRKYSSKHFCFKNQRKKIGWISLIEIPLS